MSEIKRTNNEFNRLAVRAVRIRGQLDSADAVWSEDPEFGARTETGLSHRLRVVELGQTAGRDPYNSIGMRARPRSG